MTQQNNRLKAGTWRVLMYLAEGVELPFNFDVTDAGHIYIRNAHERIKITEIEYLDSGKMIIRMPVFSTYFEVQNFGDSLRGFWVNPEKPNYQIPIFAQYGRNERFAAAEAAPAFDANGKWEVTFSPDSNEMYKAIGVFEQNGHHVIGTFLTETGDYRYLEGQVEDGHLFLSCFDGAHVFLFKGRGADGKIENGFFWSGNHWKEPWVAIKNDTFKLSAPDTLTYLKEGYERFEFAFPNENGDTIRLSDKAFQNKVVIVQIMGSWCPNCMDESVFLTGIYEKYKDKGLEIVAIDYEIRNDFEVFKRNIARMRKDLGVKYSCLFGGPSKKSEANKTLPMLNQILSYPTTIFIDRKGNIRKIQTGFCGPGTGDYYDDYVRKTNALIEKMM